MEKLLQLPQIRISLLEEAITSRKKKKISHKKSPTTYLDVPVIEGSKPSYMMSKQHKHILQHGYLKCGCKNQHHCSPHKHQYLHRKYGNQMKLLNYAKCKTQSCQTVNQLFSSTNRANISKQQHFLKHISKQLTNAQLAKKVKTIFSKIQAALKEKIFIKYGLSTDNQETMKIIHEKITHQYLKRQNNIVNNQVQLIKQIQKYLQSKKIIKIGFHKNKKRNKNKKQTVYGKQNKINMQNLDSRQSNDWHQQNVKRYKIQQTKQQTKQQEFQKQVQKLVNIFLSKDSEEMKEQYFKSIINAGDKQFEEQTKKLKQLMEKYGNKSRLRKQIVQTIIQLMQKIKSSSKTSQEKKMKLHALNKLFKVSINVQGEQQQGLQTQNKVNKFKQKSRRFIKTNKSLKTMRHFTYYQQNLTDDDENNKQNQNVGVSIGMIEDNIQDNIKYNKNQDYIINDIIQSRSPSNKTNLLSIRNSIINGSDQIIENTEEKQSQVSVKFQQQNKTTQKNICKTIKKLTKRHATHKFDNPFKDQELSDFSQEEKIQLQSLNQIKNIVNQAQQSRNQSNFKTEHRQRIRKMKEKVKIQRNVIKQFMIQNKDIINTGNSILRNNDFKNLIITENDTLLMKKKKIRYLRQKLNQKNNRSSEPIQQTMMNQILKYIDLYEVECELILFRGRKNRKNENQESYREKSRQNTEKLIKNNAFTDQLKFIKLNKDYLYGEEDENQMNFNGTTYVIQQIQLDRKDLSALQKTKSTPDYISKNFKDLLQKQIPQVGHKEQIKSNFKESMIKSRIITNNENKLYNKIRRVIKQTREETCKLIKSSRFLLTQNLNSSFDMSIVSKLNEN